MTGFLRGGTSKFGIIAWRGWEVKVIFPLVALIAPHKGKFNVTAKGGVIDKEYLDWAVARPQKAVWK